MAKKPVAPLQPEEIDLSEMMDGEMLNPALEHLFAELGGEGAASIKVHVLKVLEDGRLARVWQGTPVDYDLMAIARKTGSGDYKVMIYGPNPSGRGVSLRANQVIPVLLDAVEDARLIAMRKGEIPATAAPGTPGQPTMQHDPANLAAAVAKAIQANQPQQMDMLGMMDRLAGIMQKMMPAQTGGGMSGVKDALELARSFMAMSSEGKSDADAKRNSPGEHMMNRVIDLLVNQANRVNPQPAQAIQTEVQPSPAPKKDVTVKKGEAEQLQAIRNQLQLLANQAASGRDPVEVAEFIYDDVPDELIAEMATNPQWFEILCGNVPECRPHEKWFAAVREQLIAFAKEDGILTPEGHLQHPSVDGTADQGNARGNPV